MINFKYTRRDTKARVAVVQIAFDIDPEHICLAVAEARYSRSLGVTPDDRITATEVERRIREMLWDKGSVGLDYWVENIDGVRDGDRELAARLFPLAFKH